MTTSPAEKKFYGVYRGVVQNNNDPENQRRLKLVVPQITQGHITNWAWALMPSALSTEPPAINQGVWVMFEGGDLSYPLWFGAFGKNKSDNKKLYIKPLDDATSLQGITSLLIVDSKQDGTKELNLTDSLVAMATAIDQGTGTAGAQGVQGIQGSTGTQGTTGAGTQGLQGQTGTQGTQGIQGISGATASAPLTLTQSSNDADYPLTISSANEQAGGSGYSDIMKFINSKSGATNINKHIRMNSTGNFEIVNSAYTATILALTDAGNLSVPGTLSAGSYSAGQTIKTTIWSNSDMSFTSNYTNATSSYTTIASKTYTPASSSSYIFVEVYARYDVNGGGGDTFFSQLTWNSSEFGYQHENWVNGAGGGSRSSKLFPLVGRITNGSLTGFTLAINTRRESSDDTITVYPDSAFYVKITEIAR